MTKAFDLNLKVHDPEVVTELARHSEGAERNTYAVAALRLGILALRDARGEVDARKVREESDRLLSTVKSALQDHASRVVLEVANSLGQFLDPRTGLLPQRLESLVRRDGELDSLLARHLSGEGSQLAHTLASHLGEHSPLFRLLSPTQADGLLATLRKTVEEMLEEQRKRVVGEFSLDSPGSALARLVREVLDANGKLKGELEQDLAAVVEQFSLDAPDSALSRLVAQVDKASQEIAAEFSLDVNDSSLNRLRREVLGAFGELTKAQTDFQTEVRATLGAFRARKEEAARSTRHGGEFEEAVCEVLGMEVRRLGDLFAFCGATTGRIAYSKVGDAVAILGPDSAAPGARIVVEVKAQKGYDDAKALEELRTARENREAQVGIFVLAKRVAPAGMEVLTRYGSDLIISWDEEDPTTDLYIRLAYSVARALLASKAKAESENPVDFSEIDAALIEVRKKAESLEEVTTWAQTIRNSSEKIESRIRPVREALIAHVERLQEQVGALRAAGK